MIRSKVTTVTTVTTTAAPQVSGRYCYGMVWLIFRRFFCVWWRNSMGQWVYKILFRRKDQFLQARSWFGWYIHVYPIYPFSSCFRATLHYFLLAFSNRRILISFGQRTQKTVDGYGWDHTDHTGSMVMLIHFLRIPTRSTAGMTEGCGAKFWLRYGEIRYGGRAWIGWRCRHQMGI